MRSSPLFLAAVSFGAACALSRMPFAAVLPAAVVPVVVSSSTEKWPGPQRDGSVLLPNMWSLRPVGKQVLLADFPVNIALHPSGKWAAVLHSGYSQNEVTIVQIPEGEVISRVPIDESFYGIVFSPRGNELYCSGAGDEVIHRFDFKTGYLSEHRIIPLRRATQRGVPAGIAISPDNERLYCANLWGQSIDIVSLRSGTIRQITLATNQGALPSLSAPLNEDEAAVSKRAEAALQGADSHDPFPYTCLLDPKRNRLYVSFWAQASVAIFDAQTGASLGRWAVEEHPNEMLLSKDSRFLFVANANRNTVSILDAESGRLVETLVAELKPNSPPGSTPNSLALSPDQSLLFVANANINTVAVFDVKEIGKSRSLGFIPVGWYPTSVRVTPDGKKLLVTNGKGLVPKANRYGPQPGRDAPAGLREYIGGLFRGTLSIIDIPRGEKFQELLKTYTATAYQCMPQNERLAPVEPGNPIPVTVGAKSPIKYCIYIIKENRTYDQMLGDMKEGRGDPSICLFGEQVSPNHHKLAREFVLLDNFYVESEVSADGHEWTVGAYATDFVEKSWPLSYGHNKHKKYPYPSEGNFPIATPAGGYLWDRAKEAGVTYRSYGEFIQNGKTPNDPAQSRVSSLKGHFDPLFRGFDMDYPDSKRADRFISELNRFEQEGEMPRLTLLRLPNDHTAGTAVGKLSPSAYVADNDLALGRVIEAVSHSKFWPQTAIFIVEDDAQNGPDHIDAHRTIAFVISPYTKRKAVDSTMYSTSSMLRTMELILGLRPMSQFDANANPMFNAFQTQPDARPFLHEAARMDLTEKNLRTAWGSDVSRKMDFTKEDAADDIVLNEIIWRSVKGADSPMPAPTRAAFVFAKKAGDDDDD
ncbi:MAG TPA: beta-propeller fold lactonase family protein [Verrucomicrobiae bacterium]|nr:beta-propeller fold lactonase family protein [Verrucomicrobiae bacterium]